MRRLPAAAIFPVLLLASVIGLTGLREAGAQGGPPEPFTIISAEYRDIDGDQDMFPDTSETGRIVLVIQNNSGALTSAKFFLSSSDPDVSCITKGAVNVGSIAAGQTIIVGSLNPNGPGLEFRASSTLTTVLATDPAKVDLCVKLKAQQLPGQGVGPICFTLSADLDLPAGASQTFVAGPDGIPGNSDDGTVLENFDVDRDGDGDITVNDTFRLADAGTGSIGSGSYLRGAAASSGTTVGGVACGGYQTPPGSPGCILDTDYPMDWHVHCPPGATNCPNVESGTCVDGCSFDTPTDGTKALSAPNSLHMGAHFDPSSSLDGDSTHFRTLQGFVSAPLNLAINPRPGDLQMAMFQIADLMDDNGVGPDNQGMCSDCADVQVQVDLDSDPAVDNWGTWDKLVPFLNVYDHTPTTSRPSAATPPTIAVSRRRTPERPRRPRTARTRRSASRSAPGRIAAACGARRAPTSTSASDPGSSIRRGSVSGSRRASTWRTTSASGCACAGSAAPGCSTRSAAPTTRSVAPGASPSRTTAGGSTTSA